jgi:hypothetical protein
MYAFLLVAGAVITAAGIALVGSGVSIQEHAIDPMTITPGVVAVVGGLILIGLGFALRVLLRIENVLAARPMPRTVRPGDTAATPALTTERPNPPVRIPFPPKPKTESPKIEAQPQLPVAAGPSAPAPGADVVLEQFREKFPTLVRIESAPVVEESDVSLSPRPPGRGEEVFGGLSNGHAPGGANGAAPAKMTPRPEANPRPGKAPDQRKPSVFESLWPKGSRVGRQGPAAAAQIAAPPAEQEQPVARPDAQSAAAAQQAPVPVSILKSGVVDGMAYTLYSDGSIEAQLPQGTLRFGSITELRNHIEQGV